MDGRRFFEVADRLRASASEAERRTSISRSYYALFNVVLGVLSAQGVIFRETPDDHYTLISYLNKAHNRTAGLVGSALKDLRLEPNRADYDMKATVDARTSEFLYLKATRAIAQFDAIPPPDLQEIVVRIQQLS